MMDEHEEKGGWRERQVGRVKEESNGECVVKARLAEYEDAFEDVVSFRQLACLEPWHSVIHLPPHLVVTQPPLVIFGSSAAYR